MRRFSSCVLTFLLLVVITLLTVSTPTLTRAGTFPHFWSQRFGNESDQEGYDVATDASGNVFLVGALTGTINFGGGDLSSTGPFDYDIFLVKFNSAGVHQWSKRFGEDAQPQVVNSVAVDPSGNVVIAGTFRGTVNFGGGDLTSAGGPFDLDIFVAKFDQAGNFWWAKRFGDASDQVAYGVATDVNRNVIVTGIFDGTVNFGGGNITSNGGFDIFVAQFGDGGNYRWSHGFGDASNQQCYSVATDPSGSVFITGSLDGTADFGGGSLVGAGGVDVFLAKFDPYGSHLWSERFGDATTYAFPGNLATDGSGNAIITGGYYGTINFGGGDLVGLGGGDIFLAKFDETGAHQWSQRFGDAEWQNGGVVAADASGNVVITGGLNSSANFGGGDLVVNGAQDIYVAKFNSAGVHQTSRLFGDSYGQIPRSVTADANGNVILTGGLQGTIDFGGGNLAGTGYSTDIFLAKLGGQSGEPAITSIVDIGNDQGRRVKIRFARSGADNAEVSDPVVRYDAFRRDDAPPAAAAVHITHASSTRQPQADGWTQVGSVSAYGDGTYGIDVPTIGDSTIVSGQYYSKFFIRAGTGVPTSFYDSPPDSGYSVDNLAPSAPSSFILAGGSLHWNASKAEDFDYFSVYGSNTNSFASATLIDYAVDPTLSVISSPYSYYYVTATDFSGNEGKPSVLHTASGVGGTPTSYVLSVSAYPNPFNPATTIRYTVPSKGRVEVAIYDLRGMHVATLVNEEKDSGSYTTAWDAKAASGETVSSGIYFARVVHPSGTKSYKMVLLK